MKLRRLTKDEARERREQERKHHELLKQWEVTEKDLQSWRRHALAARRLKRNDPLLLKRYGREAAVEQLGDYEHCLDLAGRHARESAKKTGEGIADIRDRYERIVAEFLAARYTNSEGKRYPLGTALRSYYETEEKLKEFLGELGAWIELYAVRRIQGEPLYHWKLGGNEDVRAVETLCGHAVSEGLMTALSVAYVKDRKGLMRFLEAVFTRWRKIGGSHSLWRVKQVTEQHANDVPHHQIAQRHEKIDAVVMGTVQPGTSAYRKLRSKIKKIRSRDRKAALSQKQASVTKTSSHTRKLSPLS
jgi:hypothetical protein